MYFFKWILDTYSNIEQLLLAFDKSRNHSIAYLVLSIVSVILLWGFFAVSHQYSYFNFEKINSLYFFTFLGPIGLIVFFTLRVFFNMNNEEQKILNNLIRERYYENYLSAIPEGNTPIERFKNISKEIFPQIKKSTENESKNVIQKENKIEIKYKSQKFIIEQFNDPFSINDLKKIIRKSKQDSISRYIVLGKDLTNSIQDKSFEIIMKDATKVDLITIDNDDFKIEWIS